MKKKIVVDKNLIAAFLSNKTTFKEDIFMLNAIHKSKEFFECMKILTMIYEEIETENDPSKKNI